MNDETAELNPLDVLVEEYSSKLREGSAPSVEEFARLHPSEAGELRDLLPAVVAMEEIKRRRQSGQPLIGTTAPERVGDFQIVREIGRGGMGIVFEALERTLNRRVALKILPGHAMLSTVRLQRFQREAQTAAQLHHTNIVPVFGCGEADGLHYYVMQFIEGRSLHQIVEQSIRKQSGGRVSGTGSRVSGIRVVGLGTGGQGSGVRSHGSEVRSQRTEDRGQKAEKQFAIEPISLNGDADFRLSTGAKYWHWAAHVAVQVADALNYAHSHGVLHRDIKPANILIDAQDTAWITDFGLAKLGDTDNLTRSGDLLGTLQYMAPETFNGKSDARADVYSLGLTLYEILTRRPPYSETTAAGLIHEISQHEPVHPRKLNAAIPQDLETIVLKASARAPEQRYASAAEMADDLRRFLDDRPIQARKAGSFERAVRWCRRNRTVAALSGVAVAAVLLALVSGWVGYSQTSAALARAKHDADAAKSAEYRADSNVEMSLQALEEMFEQLNGSSESPDAPRTGTPAPGDKPATAPNPNEPHAQPGIAGGDKAPPAPPGDKPPLVSSAQASPQPPRGNEGRGGPGPGRRTTENLGLVQSILTFYERFAEKNATNTKLRLESARAYERVGELEMRLEQYEKAEQAFRRSLSTLEQLSTQVAMSPSLVSLSAKSHAQLGDLFRRRKEYETADRFFTQAIEMLVPLAEADHRYRQDLSWTRRTYAASLRDQKLYDTAISVLKEAISPMEDGPSRFNSGMAYLRLADIYNLTNNAKAGKEAQDMADKLLQRGWGGSRRGP